LLAEGPERHAGKNYYLSTDVLNGMEVAGSAEQGDGTARSRPLVMTPGRPRALAGRFWPGVVMPGNIEANYAASMLEWARQTFDGRMAYSAVTTDTRCDAARPTADQTGRLGAAAIAPTSERDREAPNSREMERSSRR